MRLLGWASRISLIAGITWLLLGLKSNATAVEIQIAGPGGSVNHIISKEGGIELSKEVGATAYGNRMIRLRSWAILPNSPRRYGVPYESDLDVRDAYYDVSVVKIDTVFLSCGTTYYGRVDRNVPIAMLLPRFKWLSVRYDTLSLVCLLASFFFGLCRRQGAS